MEQDNSRYQDEDLKGNEKIEEAIKELQHESTPEQLAYTLTVIRRRMEEGGQLIVSVEPAFGSNNLNLQTIKTDDGLLWWVVFTSFDEELLGADSVKSTFLSDMDKLFEAAYKEPSINGIIINPWNRTIMLDKRLIRITMPKRG